MDTNKVVTLGEVWAAFETLLEVVGRECDARTGETIYWAREDVMAILAGEWPGKAEECGDPVDAGDEVGGEDSAGVDAERCPGCHQSLADIGQIKFACPECYGAFGDEAVEAAIRPF